MSAPTIHAHEAARQAPPGSAAGSRMNVLVRTRAGILGTLAVVTAASWAYLLQSGGHHHSLTMGGGLLFLVAWSAMIAATMFPAAAPMLFAVARGGIGVSRFVGGYALVWGALGGVAYGAAVGAEHLGGTLGIGGRDAARVGGAVIALAGAYQFSKLKDKCLTGCRSPLSFLTEHWKPGRFAATRLGVRHGLHCAGCCWAMMAAMFPLGMANIAVMAGAAALVLAEKTLPGASFIRYAAGAALLAYGLAVVLDPSLLPGAAAGAHEHMHHVMG